jgi:hypothetical protein
VVGAQRKARRLPQTTCCGALPECRQA